MTKQEIQVKSQEKVKALETLCKQLQLMISAEQVITKEGFIRNIVYYTDTEQYPVDEEVKTEEKKDE